MKKQTCGVGALMAATTMCLLAGCDRQSNATVFSLKDCASQLDAEVCGSACRETPFEIKTIVNVEQQIVMTGIRTKKLSSEFSPSEAVDNCKVATATEWVCEDVEDLGVGIFTLYVARSGNKLQRHRIVTDAPEGRFPSDHIYECGVVKRL